MPTPPKNTTPPSRTVVLKLSSTVLRRFPHESPAVDEKDIKIKDASSPPSSTSGEAVQASSFDNASDAASTPAPAATEGGKAKKGNGAGSARGTKRALDKTGDAPKAPRSRPSAARKKLKLDDKTTDTTKLMPSGHKLGPKANQGAINAGLRALDRSGTPCRKWERKPFQLKSFTGVVWGLSSWHTPKPLPQQQTPGDSSGVEEANGVTPAAVAAVNGDSDSVSKANLMSSAVPSEKSNAGDVSSLPPSTAQSPAPAIAMTA
ncbi:INO80 complex subunit 4 [Talaromyces pinophilus]|nr:INO80 complex subunit 4 [Talaromyces pinophilus]